MSQPERVVTKIIFRKDVAFELCVRKIECLLLRPIIARAFYLRVGVGLEVQGEISRIEG